MPDPVAAPDTPTVPPPIPIVTPVITAPDPPPLPPPPIVAELQLDDEDRKEGVSATESQVTLPAPAFKRIKDRERSRARRDAEVDLLKQIGVGTIEEARAIVTKSKEPPVMPDPVVPVPAAAAAAPVVAPAPAPVVPAPAPTPAAVAPAVPAGDDRAVPEATRRILREQREAAEAATRTANAAAEAARAQASASALEVERIREEGRVREALLSQGVVEVDFVFSKLQEHLRALDDAALKAFDRAKWLTDYKAAKPFLFREHVAPADTTPAGAAPGTPPTPGDVSRAAAAAGQKDARKMTDAERRAHYATSGIKLPPGSRTRQPSK